MKAWAAGVVAAVSVAAGALAQGVIELRASAIVAPGVPVTLGAVARLEGGEAQAWAETVVHEPLTAGQQAQVDLAAVRRAMERTGRVHWGRVMLRGGTCRVEAPAAFCARAVPAPTTGGRTEAGEGTVPTVRAAVAAQIAQLAGVPASDVRLDFAPEDAEFLDEPVSVRTLEIRPTAMSDRLPLAVSMFEGQRLVARRTIRVGVEVRRDVPVALASKRKGETLRADEVRIETRWVGLTVRPAASEAFSGAEAAVGTRLTPGQVIQAGDLAPPVVVRRGEPATVHCVSGTVVITTRARALAEAREGETIEFESLDGRRRFTARVDGRGRAVIVVPSPDREP